MKSTIKLSTSRRVVTQPTSGGVLLSLDSRDALTNEWHEGATFVLTPEQVGALLFGLESAAEAARIAAERDASWTHERLAA